LFGEIGTRCKLAAGYNFFYRIIFLVLMHYLSITFLVFTLRVTLTIGIFIPQLKTQSEPSIGWRSKNIFIKNHNYAIIYLFCVVVHDISVTGKQFGTFGNGTLFRSFTKGYACAFGCDQLNTRIKNMHPVC